MLRSHCNIQAFSFYGRLLEQRTVAPAVPPYCLFVVLLIITVRLYFGQINDDDEKTRIDFRPIVYTARSLIGSWYDTVVRGDLS